MTPYGYFLGAVDELLRHLDPQEPPLFAQVVKRARAVGVVAVELEAEGTSLLVHDKIHLGKKQVLKECVRILNRSLKFLLLTLTKC